MDSYHHQAWDSYPNLNIAALSVASPPSLSPATPLSPYHQLHQPAQFNFDHHPAAPFADDRNPPPASSSRPSTSAGPPPASAVSAAPLLNPPHPRKRSASAAASTLAHVDEALYDDPPTHATAPLDLPTPSEDHEMRSPIDGSGSTSGAEDGLAYPSSALQDSSRSAMGSGPMPLAMAGSMNILGKPLATNNFVTKLYQMISDPKSAHFIAWTELGTSFVVSNVGEFSRSILGSHFKHNNFSSFVRQLNMYGFHKINRTPRAQRTSTDAQTWEFSHHKFLRGRPDLLDEIKRKALEPDPTVKHRVELPGEVAAQLGAMRDENRRMWEQLSMERKKVDKLVGVVNRLWDMVQKVFPGNVPQFPTDMFSDLSNAGENPNIYITSPTTPSRYPPPLSINFNQSLQSIQSPSSSPTSTDFPHSHHTHPSLSRQHSFQHVGYGAGPQPSSSSTLPPDASDNANASSPSAMEGVYEDDSCPGSNGTQTSGPRGSSGVKRPRLSTDESGLTAMGGMGVNVGMNGYHHHMVVGHRAQYAAATRPPHQHHLAGDVSTVSSPGTTGPPSSLLGMPGIGVTGVKKNSRARSDSAPLGPYSYASSGAGAGNPNGGNLNLGSSWLGGRPRSGSGLVAVPRPGTGNNIGMGVGRNMGNLSGLASISSSPSSANATVAGQQTGSANGPGGEAGTQGPGGPPNTQSSGNGNSLMSGSIVSDGSGR